VPFCSSQTVRQKCIKRYLLHGPGMVMMHELSKRRFCVPTFLTHVALHGASPKSENPVFKGFGETSKVWSTKIGINLPNLMLLLPIYFELENSSHGAEKCAIQVLSIWLHRVKTRFCAQVWSAHFSTNLDENKQKRDSSHAYDARTTILSYFENDDFQERKTRVPQKWTN